MVPFIGHRTTVTIGEAQLWGVRILGSNEHWTTMSGLEPEEGRFLTHGEVDMARPVGVVGADLVETLRRQGISLGDSITIGRRQIRVIGEMPGRGSTFGVSQDDYVVIPMPLFETLFGATGTLYGLPGLEIHFPLISTIWKTA